MRKALILLIAAAALLCMSCGNNIYLPDAETWQAGNKVYNTFQEALASIAGAKAPGAAEILLLRDVDAQEGQRIEIPTGFPEIDVRINLGGKKFAAASGSPVVMGGSGTAVLSNGSLAMGSGAQDSPAVTVLSGRLVLEEVLVLREGSLGTVASVAGPGSELRFASGTYGGAVRVSDGASAVLAGAYLAPDRILLEEASFAVTSGKLNTASVSVSDGSRFSIGGGESTVTQMALAQRSETLMTGGSVTFRGFIEKASGAVFRITAGKVRNPHQTEAIILEAIEAGGHPDDVDHLVMHDAQLHEGRSATCVSAGYEDYYQCRICHGLFSDAECTHSIPEPVVIPPLGHDISDVWHMTDYVHYHVCSRCNGIFDEAEHELSEIIDDKRYCLVCGYEVDMHGHVHSFPSGEFRSDWMYDGTKHWLQCECGATTSVEQHTMSEWHLCEDNIHLVRECLTCSYSEEISEPESNIINIGIGTVEVPSGPPKPCGTLDLRVEGNVFTARFVPTDICPEDYITSCKYRVGSGHSVSVPMSPDGSYTFECDSECTVTMQIATEGGTIVRSRTASPQF